MPPRTVKRGAGLAGPKRTTRGTRGAQKAQDPPPEEVAVVVAAPPKRSRKERDSFDSLPDDLVISLLCKLSSSVTCPFDFANVLVTCRRLNGLVPNSLEQPDSHQRIADKILETLKRHLPVSGEKGLRVFGKSAIRLEENIYTAATSQSDYLRKISLKMLTLESMFQNPIGNAFPSNSAGNGNNSPDAASLDYSTAQTGHANGADWQEEIYQKIETMKDLFLPEISEMYQKIAAKLQQHDFLPQQPMPDQLEKLQIFKTALGLIITFLQVSKNDISPGYKVMLGSYVKQIINFISA